MKIKIDGYSDQTPITSQIKLIQEFQTKTLGSKLFELEPVLDKIISSMTDKPLALQITELDNSLDIPAYQGAMRRNEAYFLSSDQLYDLTKQIANTVGGRRFSFNSESMLSDVVSSHFNNGVSTLLNSEMHTLDETRRQEAEAALRMMMGDSN